MARRKEVLEPEPFETRRQREVEEQLLLVEGEIRRIDLLIERFCSENFVTVSVGGSTARYWKCKDPDAVPGLREEWTALARERGELTMKCSDLQRELAMLKGTR
jgi:hypothetical protein